MSVPVDFEADIIIAGGGSAGCVVAGRLAVADTSLQILVLEAGPPTQEDLEHVQPARYLRHLQPGSKTIKRYVGKESAALGGRAPVVPCAQCLGGGSSVNFAMYARAAASDYDDWETVHENPGWGSKDLIPLLKETETYQEQPENVKDTHGYTGPLKVSYGGLFTNVGQQFLRIALEYDKERTVTGDPNDLFHCNNYARWEKWISRDTGRRSDTPHHYIYNQESNANLKVMTGYRVTRVIIENGRAVGVEYSANTDVHPNSTPEVRAARARQLVLLSAGALGSPGILERSGIGADTLMQRLGIKTFVDLPGVGENYQDHIVCFTPYIVSDEAETLDGIVRSEPAELDKWTTQWLKDGSGLMAHNGVDAGIRIRPSARELEKIGPEFKSHWEEYFANAPDKPVMYIGEMSQYVGDLVEAPNGKYCCMDYFLDYPASQGYIHITSANDLDAAPDFDPKFLEDAGDLALLRWAYKHGRELTRRMPMYRGEYLPGHPVFSPDSAAICHARALPAKVTDPDITYSEDDDKAINQHLRKVAGTTWHSLGTCAMRPREKNGVVDSRLNVYGVSNLKVADLSIAPSNVSANTYSTALVIGEKAATIIREELTAGCI